MALDMADVVAWRGTCPRLAAGAVVTTPEGHVLSTGYNGAPHGLPHCVDVGCRVEGGHCVRSLHAELNAILHAARHGVPLFGAHLFCTHRPCVRCALAISQVGIARVYYGTAYDSDDSALQVLEMLTKAGVAVVGV